MTDTKLPDSEGLPRPPVPPSIQRLGDFELLREIGRGGMGVVYEARQISLGRRVALKVLPPTLGMSPDSAQRFEREARAAAKLHHTNIVPVHGIGQQDGHHFYAMELIEGPSLDQLLADRTRESGHVRANAQVPGPAEGLDATRTSAGTSGSLASSPTHRNFEGTLSDSSGSSREWFDSVARLVAPVANALAYAHRRGIIHRDIKPGNLILSPEGQLCLTDFGLARMSEDPGMTVTGSFLGTPAYMSPEQIAAGRIELDHRTDIYSLGVVLYEMLTLERPFEGRSRDEMLTSIMTREPEAPRKVNPKIPRDLETICLKAIEKDPARRYATAEAFAADLQQFLAHELIGARRTSPLRRAAKVVRRHPVLAVSVLAAVLLAVVGGIAWQTSRRAELGRLLGEAELALGRGESRVALDRADRVLERDPEFTGGRLIRARALLGIVGRQQEAIADGEAMIAADPDDWKGHAILVSAAHAGFYGKPLEPHVEAVERLAPQTAEAYTLRALVSESSLEALELLDRALRTDPGYAEALEARATRHLERNDFRAALEDADRLLAARPRSSTGRLLRAVCFVGLHDAVSARAAIEEAIRLAPVAENYAFRSALRSITGDAAGAWEDIVTATGLEPNNAGLLLLKAGSAMSAGRLDDALQAANKSVALDPTNPSTYEQLVAIHRARGEHDRIPPILGELDRIAREATEPKFVASVRSARSSILLDQGDLDGAVAETNAAVAADPKNPRNYLLRARLVQRRDGFEAMAQDCRHAASIPEEEPGRLFSRAIELNYYCRMEELALADLDRLAKLTPGWPDAREARGWIHLTAKRYEEALADFKAVAEIAPEWDWIWFRLGSTLFELHRYEESIRAFERARKLGASDTLDESWARALIALRRDEEALRVADARIERMPGRGSAYAFKGVILARLGRLTEASESITRGIQLEPERDWGPYVARAEVSLFGGLRTCEENLADLDKALKMNPDARSDVALVAGMCLSQRCPALYDPRRFETLAREAVALDPRNGSSRGALGVVLFEVGRYTEARGELDQVLKTQNWSDPVAVISLQYLAMTEWRLGNRLAARDYQKHAAALIDQLTPKDPGFIQLQKRVDALLGTVG